MSTAVQNGVAELAFDLLITKRLLVASSALFIYDYLLTLKYEIVYGWGSKRTFVFYLFILNRYVPLMLSVLLLFAWFSPLWTTTICDRVAFAEYMFVHSISLLAESFLALRVYAVTDKNKRVVFFLLGLIVAQTVDVIYAMVQPDNTGMPVPPIPVEEFHVCILDPQNRKVDAIYLCLGLSFDTIVIFFTLFTTIHASRYRPANSLIKTIQRDGMIYFFFICSLNFIWLMFVLFAKPGLRNATAAPYILITPIVITRLHISLKQVHRHSIDYWHLSTLQTAGSSSNHTKDANVGHELRTLCPRP